MASPLQVFLNLQRVCTRRRISHLSYATPSSIFCRFLSQSPVAASGNYTKPILNPQAPLSILEDDNIEIDLSEDDEVANGARPGTPPLHARNPSPKSTPEEWRRHRQTLKERFPNGWSPPRKISRDAMDGLRQLHHINPVAFTTEVLAEKFRVSPEAVRRILKSKWEPSQQKKQKLVLREKEAKRETRLLRRGRETEEAIHLAKDEEPAKPVRDRLTMS